MNNIFITFIIPSIGRESLKKSIQSLLDQDDNDWNAIILLDGIKNSYDKIEDKRINIIELEKINNAGLIRNIGINYCKNTEWIGFLDDDDYLSNDYISSLKKEILINKDIEICIFRMAYSNGYILPSKYDKNIIMKKVGISFVVKKYVFNRVKFSNYPFEDYLFLKDAQNKKYKIIISSFVTYFVRTTPTKYHIFPKVLINF